MKYYIPAVLPSDFSVMAYGFEQNGSSPTGNCSETMKLQADRCYMCSQPCTSVLFDGEIPTLRLDEDTWARQLLTLNANTYAALQFELFEARIDRVEIVMFNCPKMGIGVTLQ